MVFRITKLNKLQKRALEYTESKQFEQAIEHFLKILKEEPKHAGTWLNLGRAYHDTQNYEKAIESFTKALQFDADLTEAKFFKALSLIALGRIGEARTLLESGLKKKPDFIPGALSLAKIYWHQGEHQKSIEFFANILQKEPQNEEALLGIGEAYYRIKNNEKALEYFELLATHHPENIEALLKLGELYGNNQKFEIAREKLENVLKLKPNLHDALLLLAKIDILTVHYSDSIKKLVQLNNIFPNNAEILFYLGTALGNGGDVPRAIEVFEKSIENRPNYADAWKSLAKCYTHVGNKEKAEACEEKYRKLLASF